MNLRGFLAVWTGLEYNSYNRLIISKLLTHSKNEYKEGYNLILTSPNKNFKIRYNQDN